MDTWQEMKTDRSVKQLQDRLRRRLQQEARMNDVPDHTSGGGGNALYALADICGIVSRKRKTPNTDVILEARMNDVPDHMSGGATERECYLLLLYYLKGAEREGSRYFPPMFEETTDLDLPAKLRGVARAWLRTGKSVQVTEEQIDRHAAELGIERQLGKHMKLRIRRFSELLLALEKLEVVRFGDGVLANRSLFGFEKIEVLKQEEWIDAIVVASESKYFGGPSSGSSYMLL